MEWSQLLSPKRVRTDQVHREKKKTDLRSSFEKDYHRIIGSASFRDFRTRRRYFRWIKVILSGHGLPILWRYHPSGNLWDRISENIF